MKAKSAIYYIALLIFIITPIGLGYYIFVNTVLANSVLPNIRLESSDVSFYTQEELKSKIQEKALESFPKEISVNFEDRDTQIQTKNLDLAVNTYDLVNYGKGNDIFKVISQGFNLLKGVEVNVDYSLSTDKLLSYLGINLNATTPSVLNNNTFNCFEDKYKFTSLDSTALKNDLLFAIHSTAKFKLDLNKYLTDTSEKTIYAACLKYKNDSSKIKNNFIDKLSTELTVDNIFALQSINGIVQWKVIDSEILTKALKKYKDSQDIPVVEGDYEILDNKQIFLYKPYKEGSNINIDTTVASIFTWINTGDFNKDPFVLDAIQPKVLSYGLPIFDFTQEIGTGKTRIELIRNGFDNFVIAYTMFGLDEINRTVLNPGEEFSYIKAIDPQPNGTTKSGRPIAGGICNSTTTLFRGVLEAGLPVLDRSSHAHYVPSYEWGYPANIVDAAYFTDPIVDFKFKNDSDFPILIKVDYSKDTDFQYNTVHILTSSQFVKRQVELSDWKIWDKYSATNFKGSFDRTVSIEGKVLFKDNFYSHYL